MFVTSLSASCSTIRSNKQLHFDPGRIAVMVRGGSTTHPSNCTRLWCSKYPQSTEVRRPGPDHRQADALECLRQVQHQGHRSQVSFPRSIFEPLHLQQNFPDSLLTSSVSAINSVPINTVLQVPFRQLRRSQSFPPTYHRRHPAATFRSAPLSPTTSTTFPFVSFVKRWETSGWIHRNLLLFLPCTNPMLSPTRTH